MATIIDALIVELGLDSSKFSASQKTAVRQLGDLEKAGGKAEKSTKRIEKASKEAAVGMDNLSRTVASFLAIIGGTVALKNWISDFIEGNAQLDRLSKNLGLSVSTISAWSNATEKLGGNAAALQGTLDMLSKSQTQLMITGESSLLPYMSALGISLADVNGKARPVDDILLDLADRFSRLDRTTANNLGRMMGLDQGTMNLLLQGRKELELEIQRQKEQTAVTKEQAAQAQKFQTEIAGIKQKFQALGRTLFMEAAPYLEKLFDIFQRFATWAGDHEEFIKGFLTVLAVGLGAIALATAPINLTVAAVVALAGAIALLWDDYQTWKKGGDSLIDWGKWKPAIDFATAAVSELNYQIKDLIHTVQVLHDLVPDSWARGVQRLAAAVGFRPAQQELAAEKIAGDNRANRLVGALRGAPVSMPASSADAASIQKFFQSQGWSAAQAAGIAANLMSESGGNPNATGDSGKAFGLAQWHADRQAAFKAWSGHDIKQSTLAEQLAFIQYELTKGNERSAGDLLRGATTAAQAGSIISRNYERPADVEGEASRRGAYASVLSGIPGASALVANAPGSAAGVPTSVDRSVQTTIGQLTVNTQATDADGMARDLEHSLDYLFASQANTGLN